MDLVCADCDRSYPADCPWRCSCGGPLEFATRPDPPADPARFDRDAGLWAFADLLPIEHRVSLGEGWTPLVAAPEWDATFKCESLFPTGSFKDRGATATVSRAAGLGVDRVVEDSSGNAGLAVATYAARAGIDAEIFVPADARPAKRRAIERTGATLRRIEGPRAAVTDACVAAVEEGDAHYASHAWDPAFFAGTSTVAFEVAAQREWTAPDAFVTPLGHGTLFLGAFRGFAALAEAGWIDDVPRLYGVQAAGVAPIVEALGNDPGGERNDAADGIQIEAPARKSQILDAVAATGGDAVTVGCEATATEHDRLARAGFHVEPTCATATAGLDALRERGAIDDDEDVVVALTGTGLKQ